MSGVNSFSSHILAAVSISATNHECFASPSFGTSPAGQDLKYGDGFSIWLDDNCDNRSSLIGGNKCGVTPGAAMTFKIKISNLNNGSYFIGGETSVLSPGGCFAVLNKKRPGRKVHSLESCDVWCAQAGAIMLLGYATNRNHARRKPTQSFLVFSTQDPQLM